LIQALKEIAEEAKATGGLAAEKPKQPKAVVKPLKLEAVPVRKERILLADAAGRVCATSVIPYPPGIPMVCPGEVFDEEVIAYIADRRRAGEKVIGVDQQGRVVVGAPPASKV
jgi:lysine decarboxylase